MSSLAAAPRVSRKTVTVLFSDLVGSTAIGERHDPEQVRAVLERYFGAMRSVIERHGGTVEKFIGDAIMAIFGIPVLHEDDALRAVRAAAEMHSTLADLNGELRAAGAPRIEIRTGVNTGEVVTGGEGSPTLATGDAVNTAARLEQAAAPGEILLGELTWQLVNHAVEAEPAHEIAAKGKAAPVAAHRLIRVVFGAAARSRTPGEGPLIGRTDELQKLRALWGGIVASRKPRMCLVLGSPGVGKSRLVDEFAARVGDAAVLRGTCLPYGEGITYWPLAEVIRSAARLTESESVAAARAKVDTLLEGMPRAGAIGARLAEAIGIARGGSPQAEIFWAVRRTLEWLARDRPLLVVWDDLQWAEPTFVELVRHLAAELRDAPILLLVMARSELVEDDPEWATDAGAMLIGLDPLSAEAADDLIGTLPGGSALPSGLRLRIADAAEGNPLFVEEMLAMIVDEGGLVQDDDGWRAAGGLADIGLPPTITALLAARIDRLARDERVVAERASVVGRTFESGAVIMLSPEPERPTIASRLGALARRQIVEPEADRGIDGSDLHRFRHLLIRDAAYRALSKSARAALHESVADWLEGVVGERIGEFTELVAHHLVQAYRFHLELGVPAGTVEPLGSRAAALLSASASGAAARGDVTGAIALRRRALDLPMSPADRAGLLVEQARGHTDDGALDEARALLEEAAVAAASVGSEPLEMRILVGRGFVAASEASGPPDPSVVADAERAAAVLEAHGDAAGVARAMDLLAHASFFVGDYERAGAAWRSASEWASRSGDRAQQARLLALLPGTSMYGWATKSEAIASCQQLAAAHPDSPMLQARALAIMAGQHAERGDFDVALGLREESRAALNELGLPWLRIELHWDYADVDTCREDWAGAEREMMVAYDIGAEAGWRQATTMLALVEISYERGKIAEARRWLEATRESSGADEPAARAVAVAWSGMLSANEGDRATALETVAEPIAEALDPESKGQIAELRGRILAMVGEREEALAELAVAGEIFRKKEMFVYLDKVTERAAQLMAGSSTP